jgi:hypothetical protein
VGAWVTGIFGLRKGLGSVCVCESGDAKVTECCPIPRIAPLTMVPKSQAAVVTMHKEGAPGAPCTKGCNGDGAAQTPVPLYWSLAAGRWQGRAWFLPKASSSCISFAGHQNYFIVSWSPVKRVPP